MGLHQHHVLTPTPQLDYKVGVEMGVSVGVAVGVNTNTNFEIGLHQHQVLTPTPLIDYRVGVETGVSVRFKFCGGKEHKNLRMFENPQITGPHSDENGRSPKNSAKPALYFIPMAKWFSTVPIGHNSLQCIIKQMCAYAGFQGNRSNHSLRATTATRLFKGGPTSNLFANKPGVSRRRLGDRTGRHRSNVVRLYKRTSDEQLAEMSDDIKVPKMEKTVPAETVTNVELERQM
ncbi:hypothetical protein LOTGIDRAFT_158034 [Lottia gigantea]|uniref:Uncharacterized protein n=1 Tax=Lottia gigantea TaxID=225164 RepID=V4A7G4_LOTGI|nr:hypothetical protein LOTGIDRAFT_158034 [Lottia gigantea]ESO99878.1 hypothetical protein LOTGIDRAFT_158034 [Lottia gigantea]